jgi:hypothetical protein
LPYEEDDDYSHSEHQGERCVKKRRSEKRSIPVLRHGSPPGLKEKVISPKMSINIIT